MKYRKGFTFVGECNKICVVNSYSKDDYLGDDLYLVATASGYWTYRESEIEYMVKKNRLKKISLFV